MRVTSADSDVSTAKPLAIFAPVIGRWGQPWLKAHMERILPGRSVVLGICAFEPTGPCWDVDAPSLFVPPRLAPVFRNQDSGKSIAGRLPEEHRLAFSSEAHRARIRAFLIQHRVEAVLTQWLDPALPLLAVSKELGLRYYCQAHGSDITEALRHAETRRAYEAYHSVDGVVSPSEFGRQQLLQLGFAVDRTHVVRHAVEHPERPIAHVAGPVRCLAAGRMDGMKGPMLIIDAFRRALETCPDLYLDYVGDGEMMPAIRQLLRALAIEDRVCLHGFLPHDQTLEVMGRSHVLLQPSVVTDHRFDTCPVSVAEAMAHGLAIVASNHGGIPEQIVDDESGLLVDEYDTRAMGERIVALARDPGLRRRLGGAARLRARELFCADIVRAQWLDILGLS